MIAKKKTINFVDFVEQILGIKLTIGQRVIAKICYDSVNPEDLEGQEAEYATKIFGNVKRFTAHARRIITIVAGRGSGKSSVLSSSRLLHLALTLPLDRLAANEKGYGLIICPDLKTAKQTLDFVKGQAESSRFIKPLIGSKATSSRNKQDGIRSDGFLLTRPDGHVVSIECLAASKGGRSVRGRSLVGVVLDECAFFEDDNHVVNDKELFAAIQPRMMKGSQLIIASTPWADTGLLYELYRQNFENPKNAVVAVAPTLLMMPTDEMKEAVQAMMQTDPEKAQQEFFAKFMTGGEGSFFDSKSVEACIDYSRPFNLSPDSKCIACAGADLAFKQDNAAIVVVHYKNDMFHVAYLEEFKPDAGEPLLPSKIFSSFSQTLADYHLDYAIADRFNEAPFREHLEKNGMSLINIPEGQDGKIEMYSRLKSLLREGRVSMPDHPRMIKQLKSITSRPTSAGKLLIELPRNRGDGHSDLVSALVAAIWQCYKLSLSRDDELVPGTYRWHAAQARRRMDRHERALVEELDGEHEQQDWNRAGLGIRSDNYDFGF